MSRTQRTSVTVPNCHMYTGSQGGYPWKPQVPKPKNWADPHLSTSEVILGSPPWDLPSGEVPASTSMLWPLPRPSPAHFRIPTSLCSLQILHSHRGRFWPGEGEASIPHLVQTFYKREDTYVSIFWPLPPGLRGQGSGLQGMLWHLLRGQLALS